MTSIKRNYSSLFGLINIKVLVSPEFLLKKEMARINNKVERANPQDRTEARNPENMGRRLLVFDG
jgi:hypothetical protein